MKKQLVVGTFIIIAACIGSWYVYTQRSSNSQANAPEAQAQPGVKATVEIFNDPVYVVSPGATEQEQIQSGKEVAEGTRVITGEAGRAQILYPNKSVTRLDGNTEITLTKLTSDPQQIEVTLSKRRIWSRVAKLLGNESFQTQTNTVVATVRGTSFGHGILPDGRNRVISKRGIIETRCINGSQEAEVTQDAKILFDCTTGGKLPLLGLDEQIKDKDEWFFFNEEQDKELDERFGKEIYSD